MDAQKMIRLADNGYLKANRYEINITPPPALNNSGASTSWDSSKMSDICANCSSVTLPGSTIETGDWSNKGPVIKIPYRRTFNPLIINFYNDEKNYARAFFEDWMTAIYDLKSFNMRYRDEIVTSCSISSLNKYNQKTCTWHIHGLLPTRVDDIPVSYQDSEIQKVAATLEYSYYTMETVE